MIFTGVRSVVGCATVVPTPWPVTQPQAAQAVSQDGTVLFVRKMWMSAALHLVLQHPSVPTLMVLTPAPACRVMLSPILMMALIVKVCIECIVKHDLLYLHSHLNKLFAA